MHAMQREVECLASIIEAADDGALHYYTTTTTFEGVREKEFWMMGMDACVFCIHY